jgi:hypothetical protein
MDIYGIAWDFMGGQSFQAQKRKQATEICDLFEARAKVMDIQIRATATWQ